MANVGVLLKHQHILFFLLIKLISSVFGHYAILFGVGHIALIMKVDYHTAMFTLSITCVWLTTPPFFLC